MSTTKVEILISRNFGFPWINAYFYVRKNYALCFGQNSISNISVKMPFVPEIKTRIVKAVYE